jgi:hypothetical protein
MNNYLVAGAQMNDFLNENWKEVYKTMSPAIVEAFTQAMNIIVNNIASAIPFDVIYPETIP